MRKKRQRDAPQQRAIYWGGEDFILPVGYTPLSKNEDVLRCVNIIADMVSNMTLKLMQNGEKGDIRVKNGLSRKLDIEPNSFMTRKTFIFNIVKDLYIYGNKIVVPQISTSDDYINELIPIPGNSVSFINKSLGGYQISCNGQIYNPNEVLHFVLNPSSLYPYVGEGVAPMLKNAVADLVQAQATKTGFLQSKWKPSLIISTPADSEELNTAEKREKILNSYRDKTEAGEPWLIPAGEIDVKTIQPLTLNDLAILDGMQLDKRAVARSIGIPPFLIGVGDFNKDEYNNFVETKILSAAMTVQQEFTKKLLWAKNLYWCFNIESLKQYNLPEKVAAVKDEVALGIINRNEGRNYLGMSPVDIDGMDDYAALENYIPVEKLGEQNKLKWAGETNGTQTDSNSN